MANELLNGILRALPRLTAAELTMLGDVVRRQREEAPGGEGLLLRDPSSPPPPPDLEGLLAKDSEGI